jgi:hypothetical protein
MEVSSVYFHLPLFGKITIIICANPLDMGVLSVYIRKEYKHTLLVPGGLIKPFGMRV